MPSPTDGLRQNSLWPSRHPVTWLWALTLLFLLRVLGQVVIRYGLTMSLYPERRWLGEGTIPIVFHWVLATYLWLWGWNHRSEEQP